MFRHRPTRIELLVLQATPFCNIDCSYCYLPDRNNAQRMSAATLDAIFKGVLSSQYAQGQITVVWHAGEPLSLPASWYEDAFERAEKWRPPDLEVHHHFQSNGMLINGSWIDLLRQQNVRIGLSIDGPAVLHDRNRRTRRGNGTHAKAMRGAAMLQDAGIPFHVITVLTAGSLDHADALFDFYVANRITNVAFNLDEMDGTNTRSSMSESSAEARFRQFFRRFVDRIRQAPGQVSLRELDDATGVIRARGLHGGRAQDAEPMRIVNVDIRGSVSTFSPEFLGTHDPRYGDFCFGNLAEDDLDTIANRMGQSRLLADINAGITACEASCAWFNYCGGGSPCNKLGETGSVRTTETLFCRLMRQAVLDVTLESIECGKQMHDVPANQSSVSA